MLCFLASCPKMGRTRTVTMILDSPASPLLNPSPSRTSVSDLGSRPSAARSLLANGASPVMVGCPRPAPLGRPLGSDGLLAGPESDGRPCGPRVGVP